ncbi:PEP-CTERM sorting domain-containing protein [Aestuariibacter sp. AA17]|uniref:PEP-CTERM sorting domain-containing protein n=1 Tax=Fluctibacter corallii TaxID=2984329 RepID=A0ABT3ABG7_9ALTE|nr:PEP-CTERM sorting domain-containing protein [Aestuariibacter sp. AA17]MCV2886015.1 PEP-CTERM sorting domain-containing protein [Aestuariibacter sp. AA17]
MKMNKTLFAATLLSLGASVAEASTINVGGVTWDPEYVRTPNMFTPGEADLVQKISFNQWFVDSADAGTINAGNAIDPAAVDAGDELQAVGFMNYFNGLTDPEAGSTGFCVGCELTFKFSGLLADGFGGFDIAVGGAFVEFFVETGADINQQFSGTGTSWLKLAVDEVTFAASSGTSSYVGGNLQLALSAVGGPAASNMDTNTIQNSAGGFSDIFYNADAIFKNGSFFAAGSGDLAGDSIPEPGTLAVMGLGLMGLAGLRRRKQK